MKVARAETEKDKKSHGKRHWKVRYGTTVPRETRNEATGSNDGKLCKATEEQTEK